MSSFNFQTSNGNSKIVYFREFCPLWFFIYEKNYKWKELYWNFISFYFYFCKDLCEVLSLKSLCAKTFCYQKTICNVINGFSNCDVEKI